MMNRSIILVFSVLFFAGVMIPAFAQSSDNVVINEVDINPPGDDSASISEWVEIYNPTDSDIDIGGWEIASTTVLKKTMTEEDKMKIKNQFVKIINKYMKRIGIEIGYKPEFDFKTELFELFEVLRILLQAFLGRMNKQ